MSNKMLREEILRDLRGLSTAKPNKLKIVVEEQYTPREWLCQRYKVSLIAVSGTKQSTIAVHGELVDPVNQVQNWMLACGLTIEDVELRIPE